ncbi:iron ABC transporter permease [Helcobacillus massiliensis]|uniref:Iron complex transport system permease protein n=1 Tax=Helcobacillus massiliensis TaxID=521392 RepID=A0A839QS71_9MICO|nr:iron ABC transporter permease [Helcobacillus massiliensis]MCG7427022.1 iron ABC transporter permease [Helcobacillus sp. ACRRO]MBB3023154.1 iron complex transport system permease protein [Helcobacillus massiliensis]MCT1556669.1 iron ABC transporter permease [Helcobacillus massiliensis]MCT2035863.1 iron ABC transporter permease [Helcobacillus massiliensis]MCT2331055.1 iron ABC transporter permease [Helcobacillus massiliensis]
MSTRLPVPVILLVSALALAGGIVASLTIGARAVPVGEVWAALTTAADSTSADVVRSRIPRTVLAVAVGAALAVAGAAMQGMTRNPLADPGILGLNAGAAFAVVAAIQLFSIGSVLGFASAAFLGAGVAAVAVYVIASLGRAGATPVRLALAGAGLSAALSAATSAILLTNNTAIGQFRFWQVGVLGARSVRDVLLILPLMLAGAAVIAGSARLLNTLALGDDSAAGLGISVARGRILLGAGAVLLAGSATALAGPIAFVGLVVPHAVRLLVGGDYARIIALSALLGPVLLLVADTVGRVIAPPAEVQVGVMTAVIGAPVFIALIRSGRQVGL